MFESVEGIAALKQHGEQPAKRRVVGRPFAKGMNGRELFKLRTAAIAESLAADFPNLSPGDQVQLRAAAALYARAERASCPADEAVRCCATANRILTALRRHATPVRPAGTTLGDLMLEAANTPAEYEGDDDAGITADASDESTGAGGEAEAESTPVAEPAADVPPVSDEGAAE